jgi:hypothetical protein
MSEKITNFNTIVRELLHEYPETRDSDYALYFHLIQRDDPLENKMTMTLANALQAMAAGKLPSIFSVGRSRRIVQEEASKDESTLYLCGNRKRKEELQEEVKKEIINHNKF